MDQVFLRLIYEASKSSVSQSQQYEESIKSDEEMLKIVITPGKLFKRYIITLLNSLSPDSYPQKINLSI